MNTYSMNKKFIDELIGHSTERSELNPYLFAHYIMKHCVDVIDELPLLNFSDTADEWDIGYRDCSRDATDAIVASLRNKNEQANSRTT